MSFINPAVLNRYDVPQIEGARGRRFKSYRPDHIRQ